MSDSNTATQELCQIATLQHRGMSDSNTEVCQIATLQHRVMSDSNTATQSYVR